MTPQQTMLGQHAGSILSGHLVQPALSEPVVHVARLNGEDIVVRGDIILAVGGVEFAPGEAVVQKIRERMEKAKSGDTLPLKTLRAGKVLELTARVP